MAEKKTKEPAKNEVVVANKDFMALVSTEIRPTGSAEGLDSIASEDMELPRIQMLQSTSPQVTDGDAVPGQFWHTLLEEALGKEMTIVPVFYSKRFMLWRPRHEGGGILARALDGVHWKPANGEFTVKPDKNSPATVVWRTAETVAKSGLDQWGSSNPANPDSEPAATQTFDYVVVCPERPELGPMLLSLARSSASIAKKLNGKIAMAQVDMYRNVFKMRAVKDQNPSGDTFYNYAFDRVGVLMSEDAQPLVEEYRRLHETFKANGIKASDENDTVAKPDVELDETSERY